VNRLRTTLTRLRAERRHLSEERALQRAAATAPTLDTAHEITALSTRR
jgi:hypothetical protein